MNDLLNLLSIYYSLPTYTILLFMTTQITITTTQGKNIDIELEILDEVNEQITVFSPRESGKRTDITPAEKTADALLRIQRKMVEESQPEPASESAKEGQSCQSGKEKACRKNPDIPKIII